MPVGLTDIRGTEINNSPILLVFQLVFCVASKGTYFNMLPLMRLEHELKSCTIFVELFSSVPLESKYRDHELIGNYGKARECHIEPDWLIIYELFQTDV